MNEKSPSVLVVGTSDMMTRGISNLLKVSGCTVTQDLQLTLELFDNLKPDALIIANVMHANDLWQSYEDLKRRGKISDTKVIGLSGFLNDEFMKKHPNVHFIDKLSLTFTDELKKFVGLVK